MAEIIRYEISKDGLSAAVYTGEHNLIIESENSVFADEIRSRLVPIKLRRGRFNNGRIETFAQEITIEDPPTYFRHLIGLVANFERDGYSFRSVRSDGSIVGDIELSSPPASSKDDDIFDF